LNNLATSEELEMRFTRLVVACLVVSAMVAGAALAQEGHPLKGSWLGDWGPNKTTRNQIFIVMDWDGKSLSGMLNPGTDNIPLKNLTLTPPPPPPPAAGGRGGGGGGGGGNRGGGGAAGAGGGGGRGGGGGGLGNQVPPAAAPAAPAAPPTPAVPPPPPVPRDWLVHFEADGKDRSGAAVRYVFDGKIENVQLANRAIVGTWTVGTTKNDLRIVRQ
jgi:hypothetical protein